MSAFIGHENPLKHRILAAGDLNIIYGATGGALSLREREQAVWDRIAALGLEFLGPQLPNGRPAATPQPDVPADMGDGLRPVAKASELPPDPNVGAPVPDSTGRRSLSVDFMRARVGVRRIAAPGFEVGWALSD